MYNELFFDIPETGPTNSHEFLIQRSSEYINFEPNNEEIQALQDEIAQLRTELLCSEGVCVEALTELSFESNVNIDANAGFDAVNEWTLQLLRIRHLGNAEQRLQALFSILVNRLGRRCGQWCELPFRLTHERIGELIGSTRVTSTRLISKLRSTELLVAPIGSQTVSVAPSFVESSPL